MLVSWAEGKGHTLAQGTCRAEFGARAVEHLSGCTTGMFLC